MTTIALRGIPGGRLSALVAGVPSKSVVRGQWLTLFQRIRDLFDGATDQEDENHALADYLSAPTANELGFLVTMWGDAWSELDDELDPGPITQIANLMQTLLDRRDYLPWRLVAGNFSASAVAGDRGPIAFVRSVPIARWHAMVNDLALRGMTAQKIGALANLAATDRIALGELTQLRGTLAAGADRDALDAILATCEYTDRLVRNIASGDGESVLDAIADIAAEQNPHRLAAAIDVMAQARDTTVAAMIEAAKAMGFGGDAGTLQRLHEILEQADQIGDPVNGIDQAIQHALDLLKQAVADVKSDLDGFLNSFQSISNKLVNFSIVGSSADDVARSVVSQLRAQKTLSALPTAMKIAMIRQLLDADWTGDDDEQTILAILGDPGNGARTQAELFAMYGGVGHEDYEDNIDGQENDDFYALLRRNSLPQMDREPPH